MAAESVPTTVKRRNSNYFKMKHKEEVFVGNIRTLYGPISHPISNLSTQNLALSFCKFNSKHKYKWYKDCFWNVFANSICKHLTDGTTRDTSLSPSNTKLIRYSFQVNKQRRSNNTLLPTKIPRHVHQKIKRQKQFVKFILS